MGKGYVATLCADDGGAAVYNARSLVKLYNDSVDFNDSILCSEEIFIDKIRIKPTTITQPVETYLKLYPNPAKDEVTISYQLNSANGIFAMYDMTGREIKSFNISTSSGQTTMSMADLSAGIYFYKLTSTDDSDKIGKLAVIK